jgi:hypothetical protein
MEPITKGPTEGGSFGAVYEVFTNYDTPGGRRPTRLLSVATSRRRPGLDASLIIPPPGSVQPDEPVLVLTPCMHVPRPLDGDVFYTYTRAMLL